MHVRTFATANEFIAFIRAKFGLPPLGQHDAHVKALEREHQRQWLDRADERVRAEGARIIDEIRAARINGARHQGELLEAAE